MKENLTVYDSEQEVGTVTWQKNGMTYLFSAVFRLPKPPSALQYLHLQCGNRFYRLGVPAPCGSNWCLTKRISASALRDIGMEPSKWDRAILSDQRDITAVLAEQPTETIVQAMEIPLPSAPPSAELPPPSVSTEPPTTPTARDWTPVTDIDAILSDNVLAPLLRGKSDLIARQTEGVTQLAMPYDLLDEISFTPAFCLMEVLVIEGRTCFALTIDDSGWPIAPDTSKNFHS